MLKWRGCNYPGKTGYFRTAVISEKLPDQFGKAEDLNSELNRQLRLAEDIISFVISQEMADSVRFVKGVFTPDFDISKLEKVAITEPEKKSKIIKDHFYQLEAYIKSNEKMVAPATFRFRQKQITFDEINLDKYLTQYQVKQPLPLQYI